MGDEEFAAFCAEHPEAFIEMAADGEIAMAPPRHSFTAARNQQIALQLASWARQDGRGITTDASGGFVLPNGARRSPDAAWTLKQRVQSLPRASQLGYWHLCPDFVIELRSTTDRLAPLQRKMEEWTGNGAQLAWLIDPDRRVAEIYRPGQASEVLCEVTSVSGEGPVSGFVLNLLPVWDPLN